MPTTEIVNTTVRRTIHHLEKRPHLVILFDLSTVCEWDNSQQRTVIAQALTRIQQRLDDKPRQGLEDDLMGEMWRLCPEDVWFCKIFVGNLPSVPVIEPEPDPNTLAI